MFWLKEFDKTKNLDLAKDILEQGLEYDPYNKQIMENLSAIVRNYGIQLNAEGVELANRAGKEFKAGNISTASELIREAERILERAQAKCPGDSQIKENLDQVRQSKAIFDFMEGKPSSGYSGSSGYIPSYDFSTPKSKSSFFSDILSWVIHNMVWMIWIIIMLLILIFY